MFLVFDDLSRLIVPLCFLDQHFYFVQQNAAEKGGTTLFRICVDKIESLSDGVERSAALLCAEFPQLDVHHFHSPVIACDGNTLFAAGKTWLEQPNGQVGSNKNNQFLLKILRLNMRTFAAQEFSLEGLAPDEILTTESFSLFIDPTSGALFALAEIKTHHARNGQEFAMNEWNEQLASLNYVRVSCIYRVELFESETRATFQLAELVFPLPPLKPSQHIRMPYRLPEVINSRFVPDDLRFHPLRINPSKSQMDICIFGFNSDATARLFNGHSWQHISPWDEFSKEYVELLRVKGIRTEDVAVFSTAGRIFLHDHRFSTSYADGTLYEIVVDEQEDRFRFELLCPKITIPIMRKVTAVGRCGADVGPRRLCAFSRSYGWKSPADGFDLRPGIQIRLVGPPALSSICFWNLQDNARLNSRVNPNAAEEEEGSTMEHSDCRVPVKSSQIYDLKKALKTQNIDKQTTILLGLPRLWAKSVKAHSINGSNEFSPNDASSQSAAVCRRDTEMKLMSLRIGTSSLINS